MSVDRSLIVRLLGFLLPLGEGRDEGNGAGASCSRMKEMWGEPPHLLKNLTMRLKYERLGNTMSS